MAYTLYFRGLQTTAASTAARLALLEPLTGAILAALLLGERLSATGIVGAAIIGAAVILTVQADRGRVGGDDGDDAQLARRYRSRIAVRSAAAGASAWDRI